MAWRWLFGAAALALIAFAIARLQQAVVITSDEESLLSSLSFVSVAQALGTIAARALPIAERLAVVVVPSLLVLWVVAASVGRAAILSRLVQTSRLKWSGIIGIHALRALSVLGLAGWYVAASFAAAMFTGTENPNYVSSVLVFLVLFAAGVLLWMWIHWILSIAVIFPASEGSGTLTSVGAAFRLVRTKGKKVTRVAATNGTARTAVALVFTLLGLVPLPLYRVAPGVLTAIEIVIALAYCVVSDWMLLGRLVGYVALATAGCETSARSGEDG